MNQSFVHVLTSMVPKWLEEIQVIRDEIICIVPSWALLPFLTFLKNHTNTQFKMLIDITAVDYPSRSSRFEVVYQLLSIHYNARIRVKTNVD